MSGTTTSKWTPTDTVRCLAGLLLSGTAILGHAPASHAATDLQRFEAVERHMGTLVQIVVYTPDQTTAREAFRAGFDRIGELEAILSDYRPDSELNQLTTKAVGRPVPVSSDLFTVLRASQALAGATAGAFDITQGPVIRLWREARTTGRVPDPTALQEATARSGHHRLHLDDVNQTVVLDVPGMALDVGGIGKGYAASEALAAIGTRGVRSALVAVSGDLAFSAAPPGRQGWRVGVHGGHADAPITDFLELTHAAVSTSGSSAQHIEIDGHRYSHIIDPSAATGLVDDLTVTVIAPHGLDADGLATAVSVLGAERGLALIESQPDIAALVVRRTTDGQTRQPSSRFLDLMRPGGASAPPPP